MKSPWVTLRQLEHFVAAAEAGTMSGAAERFRVSQSAVSLSIGQLERVLGVQLFIRRRARGLALTGAGSELLGDARRLLEHAVELESTARSLGQDIAGRLAIGCFPPLTPFVMPRILEDFPRRHPGVQVDFVEGLVDDLRARLLDGRCEAAIVYDIGVGEGIDRQPLYDARPYVLLPARHRLAGRDAVRLCELAGEPLVMIDMPPSVDWFGGILEQAGVEAQIRHRTTDVESVRSLVARGVGWSLLIQRPLTDLSYEGLALASVEIADEIEPATVVLATPARTRPTRRARAFADFCVDALVRPPSTSSAR